MLKFRGIAIRSFIVISVKIYGYSSPQLEFIETISLVFVLTVQLLFLLFSNEFFVSF